MKTVQELQNDNLAPPQTVAKILQGSWAIRILRSACEISIFEVLQDGPKDADAVAAALSMPVMGIGLMLDSLVALRLLERIDLKMPAAGETRPAPTEGAAAKATYALNDESTTYLLKQSPLYLGLYLKQNEELDKMWHSLTDTLKTGKPVMEVNRDEQAEEIFPRLAESIFPLSYAIAADVIRFLQDRQDYFSEPLKVLDVACGGLAWSIPFAQANSHSKIDALDFPAVLKVAKKHAEKFGVASQLKYLPGNWRDVKLEPHSYDAVLLGHILHSEGPAMGQQLLKYCYDALRPGGTLVIAEFLTNKERNGPLFPLMFGLNMHLATTEGCVFSVDEIKDMSFAAGFTDLIRHPGIRYESPVLLAFK